VSGWFVGPYTAETVKRADHLAEPCAGRHVLPANVATSMAADDTSTGEFTIASCDGPLLS
jgi:hypothetical protein